MSRAVILKMALLRIPKSLPNLLQMYLPSVIWANLTTKK